MSPRLWGLLGAALAGAALLAPSAPAYATSDQGVGMWNDSGGTPAGPSPVLARGWHLSVSNSPFLRINKRNMNPCHGRPGPTNCPDKIATMGNNDAVFAHCKKAGENNALYVFVTWREKTGYMTGRFIQQQSLLNDNQKVPTCRF